MSLQKILVTGGAGYIGSHSVRRLLEEGYEVVVFDNLSRGYKEVLKTLSSYGPVTFIEGDMRSKDDLARVFADGPFDAVLHCAALCDIEESFRDPALYHDNNVVGTQNLLEEMHKSQTRSIIFSSTCAVYGKAQYLPLDEKHPLSPENPYGESKRLSEESIASSKDTAFIIFRYFNVTGAHPSGEIGDAKNPSSLLIQNAVRGALGIAPFSLTYTPVTTPDGSPVRDFVDVNDIAQAHVKGIRYLVDGGENAYINLGSGTGVSVLDAVHLVEEIADSSLPTTEGVVREGDVPEIYASYEKAKSILGWHPTTSLADSIRSLFLWYRTHPNGYAKD